MFIHCIVFAVLLTGGVLALLCRKLPSAATLSGAISLALASLSGLGGIIYEALFCFYKVDLSSCFQIPVFVLGFASALYSPGYLAGHGEKRASYYYFFLNLTIGAMYGVTLLRDPLSFLVAWEIMGLASAALVMFDHHNKGVKNAAFLYFAACHAGAAFLILFFLCPVEINIPAVILCFLGFGLKIGFPLLHIWLPEAHPKAPAPVSAIMSGAMIELGFLGILLFMPDRNSAQLLFAGWGFLVLGVVGALWGIISALPQNNLKKLLACSSVENMGICSIAFGLAILGKEYQLKEMSAVAFCGGFLHILNHAFLKGGLFLGAGAVLKSCGTLEMDKMGGLLKRAPHTGTLFTLNAAGICGLPPFNGFISEFLIYYAAFQGILLGSSLFQAACAVVLIALAVTGGLAAAVFAKAVSGVFLGEARTKEASEAKEVPRMMLASMYILFVLSLLMLLIAPASALYFKNAFLVSVSWKMIVLAGVSVCVTVLVFLLLLLQRIFCKGGKRISPTWDCGFAKPDARMQYTATAFSQPLTDLFNSILGVKKSVNPPEKLFPEKGGYSEEVPDQGMERFWQPIVRFVVFLAEKCHSFQSGNLHKYIFVIIITLGGMLLYVMLKK